MQSGKGLDLAAVKHPHGLVDGHETNSVGVYVPVGPWAQQGGTGRSDRTRQALMEEASLPCLIADRTTDSDAFHAELMERNLEAAISVPVPRLETVPSAQRRGTRYRLAQTRAAHGHPP